VATATPTTGTAPLLVSLDASASTDSDGTVQSWNWAFGDGTTGTGVAVSHTYAAAGTYVATVTVADDDGAFDAATVTITVSAAATAPMYLSSTSGGTVGGVAFADEDIVGVDTTTGAWSMFFDGSDVGLAAVDVDAFEVLTDGRILLSTDVAVTLNRIRYDDSDVIVFTPTSTGSTTAGMFAMYASSSSLQLTTDAEDVDAIAVTAAGELVLSTTGLSTARGVTSEDEDLTRFVGATASRYFDGSTIGLTANGEDVSGASIDASGKVRFSTEAGFTLTNGLAGSAASVGSCTPAAVPVTACSATELVAATALSAFSAEVIDGVSIRG
jgi:PKD repeat protein